MSTEPFNLKEDKPGEAPPGVNGRREKEFFDAARGEHDREMQRLKIGLVGFILGDEQHAPMSIALLLAAGTTIILIGCLIVAGITKDPLWATMVERCFAFLAAIVAYIFGRGGR